MPKEPGVGQDVLLIEAVKWPLTSETDMPNNILSASKTLLLRLLLVAALLGGLGSLTACNTMEGAGKDISAGGDALEDTASDTKDKM